MNNFCLGCALEIVGLNEYLKHVSLIGLKIHSREKTRKTLTYCLEMHFYSSDSYFLFLPGEENKLVD